MDKLDLGGVSQNMDVSAEVVDNSSPQPKKRSLMPKVITPEKKAEISKKNREYYLRKKQRMEQTLLLSSQTSRSDNTNLQCDVEEGPQSDVLVTHEVDDVNTDTNSDILHVEDVNSNEGHLHDVSVDVLPPGVNIADLLRNPIVISQLNMMLGTSLSVGGSSQNVGVTHLNVEGGSAQVGATSDVIPLASIGTPRIATDSMPPQREYLQDGSSPNLVAACTGLRMAASSSAEQNIEIARDSQPPSLQAGHCTYSTRRSINRRDRDAIANRTLIDSVPIEANVLKPIAPCVHCQARLFERESKNFCCGNGQISLPTNVAPDALIDLFTSTSRQASEFKPIIRTYNNKFAFTSFGVKYDKELCARNRGIYTFRVQGQVYHYINELLPLNQHPSYLQLYFYDTEHEIENRMRECDRLNPIIVESIISCLEHNPYSQFFRNLSTIDDLRKHKIIIKNDAGLDQRVYNAPSASQVAAIWIDGDGNGFVNNRDILVSSQPGVTHKVQYFFGCYDPLQYPLLFPYGETGWHYGILRRGSTYHSPIRRHPVALVPSEMTNANDLLQREAAVLESEKQSRDIVSCREYYCYKLQIREGQTSLILRAGRLLQQYVVDMYIKIESSRLDYLDANQDELRSELYGGIVDCVAAGENDASLVGKKTILPATFIGGPRDMRRRYMDAMALVQKYGKPDLFLTMTCNPNWAEIKNELAPGEEAQNRPDLISRVFRAKVEELKNDLFKKQIFGPVAAYAYVTEFQKRGLPHVHILIILKRGAKIISPDAYDKYVCAELPTCDNTHLRSAVIKHMMHGPCGDLNKTSPCMKKNGTCKNHYPKAFCEKTTQTSDSFPIYRRRDNDDTTRVRGSELDNRWVIPYNPYLLAKYDCHLNVEICSTIKAVKYLYKYIFKGHDRVAFNVLAPDNDDEIKQFRLGRWISPPEATWRIYKFLMNEMYPSVYNLQLHLPNQHPVPIRRSTNLRSVISNPFYSKTMLTEYFVMNELHEECRIILYKDFPAHFVWSKKDRTWTPRKKGVCIGRIVAASPAEGARYYLRILLNNVRGATSFENLKLVNGVQAKTFREAAELHGLLLSDTMHEDCLREASDYHMPSGLRRLFATILVYCNPPNPSYLWNKFRLSMSEDFASVPNVLLSTIIPQVLKSINLTLQSMGKTLADYDFTDDNIDDLMNEPMNRDINDELNIVVPRDHISAPTLLNTDQKRAFDTILEHIRDKESGAFFIDGPGGTGKTFLYCALLGAVRRQSLVAIATATSGVAASIMPGGRTAHSRFKIPINIDEISTCSISKQSGLADLLRTASLIIWDEAPMAKRQAIEALDRMLQDIMDSPLLFGGKVIVFGGDFRQVLPVVPRSTRDECIDASLLKSTIWPQLKKFKLTINMRAQLDGAFSDYLLRVGNGSEPTSMDGKIKIPQEMLLPFKDDITSMNELVDIVFPDIGSYENNYQTIVNRAILTPKNDYVDELNSMLIDKFPGALTKYYSQDEAIDSSMQAIEEDFLNGLTPSGFPPYELLLKPNCPIILLRNIDPPQGLCNGTRLICKSFRHNVIEAEIAVGDHRGKRVFIPRIPFLPNEDTKNPFQFRRMQFPVRLSFTMTVNKAQGQTLDFVGIYLPQPVFSHGQLYVALSRAKTSKNVCVLIRPPTHRNEDLGHTTNVVYSDLLQLADA